MDLDKFLQNIIYDAKVDLADEFVARNFTRKNKDTASKTQ